MSGQGEYSSSPQLAPHSPTTSSDVTFSTARRPRRRLSEAAERRLSEPIERPVTGSSSGKNPVPASVIQTDDGSDEDQPGTSVLPLEAPPEADTMEIMTAPRTPPPISSDGEEKNDLRFEDQDLVNHLQTIKFKDLIAHLKETKFDSAKSYLEEIVKGWESLTENRLNEAAEEEKERFSSATYQIYDVDGDAKAVRKHLGDGDDEVHAMEVWDTLMVRLTVPIA